VREILDACRRVTGRNLRVELLPGRPIDAPANVLDSTRAARILGWSPRVEFEEGLRRTWEWIREVAKTH
jgi:UDP-glucose 4-epimerase